MSRLLIEISNLSKMYRLYRRPYHRILDLLGFALPTHTYNEFWALRDMSLKLKAGQRLGIIGRNGAGKSTLLKIVAGQLQPTHGTVTVRGEVQALMELGTGFHPEFTGRENVFAALSYKGILGKEAQRRFDEIVEFSELDEFIDNPFKTYSNGMQARLAFSVSTAIEPEILIIDEILGAGDAYFASKSGERMRQIVEGGASVLLVTHAMDQIVRYCEEAIWIERGRHVMQGASLEVVKAYEEFIHNLEDRRLQAKNRKRRLHGSDTGAVEGYGDAMVLAFELQGEPGTCCDIGEVTLLKDGQVEETLNVGDVQDTDTSHMSMVVLTGGHWSEPREGKDGFCRSLMIQPHGAPQVLGELVFYAYALFDDADYVYRVHYRCNRPAQLRLTLSRNGQLVHHQIELPTETDEWRLRSLALETTPADVEALTGEAPTAAPETLPSAASQDGSRAVARWPGEGSLIIDDVLLLGPDGNEQAVFAVGIPLTLRLAYKAKHSGKFRVIFTAVLYRLDGVVISQNIAAPVELDLQAGELQEACLHFAPLNLGNGYYVFSVALYSTLDPDLLEEPQWYDLIDRSYEFEVVGNLPLRTALFDLPAEWSIM